MGVVLKPHHEHHFDTHRMGGAHRIRGRGILDAANFPAYMGNSQFHFPLIMQIIDLFGITVVTFLVIRVNAIFFFGCEPGVRDARDRSGPLGSHWA